MTSRDGNARSRGVFLWLPLTLVVVVGLFVAGWYAAAHLARVRSRTIIAGLSAAGKTVNCRDATVTGFPIGFGVDCKATGYEDRKEGFSLTSGPASAFMALYDPLQMDLSLHGPASIGAANSMPLALDWKRLNASLSFGLNDLTGVLVEGKALEVRDASHPVARPVLFDLGGAKVTLEPNGGDLSLRVSLADMHFGAALPALQRLPPINGMGNIRIFEGAGLLATGLQSLRGRQFAINALNLDPGSDSSAAVSGNLSFDSDGFADGALRIRLHNIKALTTILAQAFPQEAQKIEPAFAMLGALGNDQTLPVQLRKGKITLGFFKIGRIPPVN